MLGRGAQGRPWIFREINHYLETGELLPAPGYEEVEQILLGHLTELHRFYGDYLGVRIARKHVSWYLQTAPEAKAFRAHFNKLETTAEQLSSVREFFTALAREAVA